MFVALGVICGIVIMALAYSLSMYGYFKLRQKYSSSKYGVEIAVLAFAVLFSIAIKTAIIFISEDATDNFWQSMSNIFKAVYSGIGGLTFEGLSDFEQDVVNSVLQCLYSGSSLYAGLMILSVLTAKISYEIYSGIRKVFGFNAKMKKGNTDFYIFNAVTEESLTLANSINDHYAQPNESRECEILFIGPDLEAFDFKDELHRDIMAHGYYYWGYTAKTDNDRGVFDYLKLPVATDLLKDKPSSKANECRVHFFAMDTNEKLSGLESSNSSAVFTEIDALLEKLIVVNKEKDGKVRCSLARMQVVDLYVLADNEINYEFYKRELLGIISRKLSELQISISDLVGEFTNIGLTFEEEELKDGNKLIAKVLKYLSSYFQVHIINEADLAGKMLAKARETAFLQGTANSELDYVNDFVADKDGLFRVMVLGFGNNGQQAMKYLYHSTAFVDENKRPSKFVADVYDPQTENSAGLFGFNNPMFICVDKAQEVKVVTPDEWKDEEDHVRLMFTEKVFNDYRTSLEKDLNDISCEKEEVENFKKGSAEYLKSLAPNLETVKESLVFPVVGFHKISAFKDEFLKYLDKGVGGSNPTAKDNFKAFIIAMGKDELNITMANSLIADVMHENAVKGEGDKVTRTLFVNLRDKKNYNRINWTVNNQRKVPNFRVVAFGASEDMFSYDTIIDDSNSMTYNYAYNKVAKDLKNPARKVILNFKDENLNSLIAKIKNSSTATEYFESRKSWVLMDAFKKQSNYAINEFSTYYKAVYNIAKTLENGEKELYYKKMMQLLYIEHERWVRFHIQNGWFFNPQRCDQIKEHDCICAFDMLTVSSVIYDLINVAYSMKNANDGAKKDG